MVNQSDVLILDFGSQYTQLIARRIRESEVYCTILPCHTSLEKIKAHRPRALILSGGPASVYDPEAPSSDSGLVDLNIPILGICYGMQWLSRQLGGEVKAGDLREYGPARIDIKEQSALFKDLSSQSLSVWMSHGDHVTRLPAGFSVYAESANGLLAAIGHPEKKIYGLQFHPEVVHTDEGATIIKNFLFNVAGLQSNWSMSSFIDEKCAEIRKQVGEDHVLTAVSGGVDSSVMAALLHKAIGNQLHAVFVDNGLLRKNERDKTPKLFKDHLNIDVIRLDSERVFLDGLRGVDDPELKRKRIGNTFIEVFEEAAKKLPGVKFLAQGTLYPDVIESVSFKGGPSATIKSHHNVGGLPEKMNLTLIEPFRELFKDEVRAIGRLLGLPEELIQRQPFPGPGLAVRILGEITEERLALLREADDIVVGEIKKAGLYSEIWQSFAVLLPVKTVGVMGDARTYENVVALRAVESQDGMTAHWVRLPYDVLERISSRIINEVRGVNRVVYDISSKPPSTIEWE